LDKPWQQARPGVTVKLLPQEGELYVLARSADRVAKERSMRRRQLKWLWTRMKELQGMKLRREDLLMKLGAARQHGPNVWRLVEIEVEAARATFTYRLNKDKLRQVRRREGRYLLRSNLTETNPAVVWNYYLQLVEVEQAFRNLKGDPFDFAQDRLGNPTDLPPERGPDRGPHLCKLPGVLPARDLGPMAAGPCPRIDAPQCPGEVRNHPGGRCGDPHERWPHADFAAIHASAGGHETAVAATETEATRPAAAPDHRHSRSDGPCPVVQTFGSKG
jgi:hypothetical protein